MGDEEIDVMDKAPEEDVKDIVEEATDAAPKEENVDKKSGAIQSESLTEEDPEEEEEKRLIATTTTTTTTTTRPPKDSEEEEEGTDEVNEKLLETVARTGEMQEGSAPNQRDGEKGSFDQLPVTWKEDRDGGPEDDHVPGELRELKKTIGELREGNLYKAVVLARELQQGRSNPMASGRFSRFLDSSRWDDAGNLNNVIAGSVGILDAFDTDENSKKVWQGAALFTNLVTTVVTFRNLAQKLRKFKGAGGVERLFLAIGMIGDIALILAKAVSIANTIASFAGKKNKTLDALKKYSFLITGTAQITALIGGSRALYKSYEGLSNMERLRKGLEQRAMGIVGAKGTSPQGSPSSWKEEDRIQAVDNLLKDDNVRLTTEEKDCLIMYLGMTRRIAKSRHALWLNAMGIAASFIGLASSCTTGANNFINGGKEVNNKALKNAATGMGVTANAVTILNSGAKIVSPAFDSGGAQTGMVQGRLWNKIRTLMSEKYGLKGLEESMIDLPQDRVEVVRQKANKVKNLYESTDEMFTMMGVPYGQLLKANKMDAFKQTLVASL